MARSLSDFFSPKALSASAFFKKQKSPYKGKILAVDMQEVKSGGDKKFSILVGPCELWITCNITNALELKAKFGDDVDEWEGKKITVTNQGREYQGKRGFKLMPS